MNRWVCSIVAGSGGSTPRPCSGSSVYGAKVGCESSASRAAWVGCCVGSGDGDGDGEGSSGVRLYEAMN